MKKSVPASPPPIPFTELRSRAVRVMVGERSVWLSDAARWGSWAEDREDKYLVGLAVGPAERLAWLEEMLALALSSGALPRPRDPWGRWPARERSPQQRDRA